MARLTTTAGVWILIAISSAAAEDWPMWRYDANRGAVTPQELPAKLHLNWHKQFPTPQPAWPRGQDKLQFDAVYEPVVAGERIFVPSMIHDSITAYDTKSGKEIWRFYTDGPVRFAPACHDNAVYFVGDDGYLYCVNAADGRLRWKLRGGPSDRKILGNDRLISTWPARGSPVIDDGVLYFTAGVWPFMGVFVHAVDAASGEILWTNSGSGSNYIVQPHGSPAFAGVSPQGYLALTNDTLIVPGGRGVPAGYDRKSGEFLFCHVGGFSKQAGGYDLMTGADWLCSRGTLCCGYAGTESARQNIIASSDTLLLAQSGSTLTRFAGQPSSKVTEKRDRRGNIQRQRDFTFDETWQGKLPSAVEQVMLVAGDVVYGTDEADRVFAVSLPSKKGDEATVTWQGQVTGHVGNMLAADDRLFVVTREGGLFCFGEKDDGLPRPSKETPVDSTALEGHRTQENTAAGEILKQTGVRDGYGVVVGGDAAFIQELAALSDCNIIALQPDATKVQPLRRMLQDSDLLGKRVSVLPGDLASVELPPYLCSQLICLDSNTVESLAGDPKLLASTYRALRPYGGVAIMGADDAQAKQLSAAIGEGKLFSAKVERKDQYTLLRRAGPLPDSAPWTHQGASVANTMMSADLRVKAPLGLLWFGGPSHEGILPRHGHGPTPQVVGGRLIIEGVDFLRAVDVYTGRLLWQRELPGVGMYYDNTGHHPGAGAIGSNYVSMDDSIYVAYGRECLRLDPANGETLATFTLPGKEGGEAPYWGYIGVYDDRLIAGSSPTVPWTKSNGVDAGALESRFAEGSARLVVMNRESGKVLWSHDAEFNFRHNAICAGGGKVFCIDRITEARLALLNRRGIKPEGKPALYALDARTGKVQWQTSDDVFGTWLSYSAQHDLLIQATAKNRDRAKDEPDSGLAAYQAKDGQRIWRNKDGYGGPVMLTGDRIITQGTAFNLLTGEPATRTDPLTGEESQWSFTRNYGCNTAIGCPNLLTFRSAAAGFFDLAGDGGTGNLGGFRSSCTANLVPADGVLNAPDYTRTCTCSYQLQCSLALVHMPQVEMWTFQPSSWNGRRVERIGINFGAPGDRRAADGTLWIDYPSVGGRSPDVPIQVDGNDPQYFRRHASSLGDGQLAWVAASGVTGAERSSSSSPAKMTIRRKTTQCALCGVGLQTCPPMKKPSNSTSPSKTKRS